MLIGTLALTGVGIPHVGGLAGYFTPRMPSSKVQLMPPTAATANHGLLDAGDRGLLSRRSIRGA